MKIEAIEMRHVRMRLKTPFRTSFGVEHDRHCLILRLMSEGLEGWGECVAGQYPGYSYETTGTAWHMLTDFFIPLLMDLESQDVQSFRIGSKGLRGHPMARAGLELALWDLMAKRQDMSLAELLGGITDRVPVGVSIGIQSSASELVDVVAGYVGAGYGRVKLKIEPGNDIEAARAVRNAFPDLPLWVDGNSAYTFEEVQIFEAMDALDLELIEQPFAEDDLLNHSKLQACIRAPVCLDESIRSERLMHQALEMDSCRVLNMKPARVGGLGEALNIHRLCFSQDVPIWCGGMLETGVGRAANLALSSLPGFRLPGDISATDRYYAEDIANPRFKLNPDSTIEVPQGPGLGIEVDVNALERFTLHKATFSPRS